MKPVTKIAGLCLGFCSSIGTASAAENLTAALQETSVAGNFNLRHEGVDNSTVASNLLTLRSRLTLNSGTYDKFSAVFGIEDIRIGFGIDDPAGLVNDREVTEIDQAYIQYRTQTINARWGRQALAFDNQRFVGSTPWRQDRRTLDAIRVQIKSMQSLSLDFAYVYKYSQGPAELNDRDANTFLFNGAYTMPFGKLTAYSYLLEDKTIPSNIDIYGARFKGATTSNYPISYTAEYAHQTNQSFDAEYLLLETGISLSGVTTRLGYELRGSDHGNYTFATPLASAHGPNGWSDVYINPGNDGLQDLYLSVTARLDRVTLDAIFHQFDADAGTTDKGDEFNLRAMIPVNDEFDIGIKYASFSQGDRSSPADVQKLWFWLTYAF